MKIFSLRQTLAAALVAATSTLVAQQAAQAPAAPSTPTQVQPVPFKGQVLFERHLQDAPASPVAAPTPQVATPAQAPAATQSSTATPGITDADRNALTLTAYDLDARLVPESAGLTTRAIVTLRNDGNVPLAHIALQISSQLTWRSATLVSNNRREALTIAQHLLDTDADHTGKASELVLALPRPLAPGASLTLDTFYSGELVPSGGRLMRIGATPAQAASTDWDGITANTVSLRGFGNVLWYPVASPQLFLGEGAQLFDAIGRTRVREATATMRLHVAIETLGDPPVAAYFCGRRQELRPVSDNADVPSVAAPGIASADFPVARLGFRIPSLFIIAHPETRVGQLPLPAGVTLTTSQNFLMLAVESEDDAATARLATQAERVAPLLQQWLGVEPLTALTLIDNAGQPFEDGPLLVAPLAALAAQSPDLALAHSLTHAWIETGQPWIDEGLAQFFTLLWIERTHGRAAALTQMNELLEPLKLIEPAPARAAASGSQPLGQPLISAETEVYFRRKAAAIWWMLRGITGSNANDDALEQALQQMRARGTTADTPADEALVFEGLLEKTSGKDLHWFFDDWVLHDRGLPDLTIMDVTPRDLPAARGRSTGWLVALTVRNDGAATADVPVTIRTEVSSNESRLRIPAFSTITTRIVVEAAPTEVIVNDGSTPEQRVSTHTRSIEIHTR